MGQKITIGDNTFGVDDLSPEGKAHLDFLQATEAKLKELINTKAIFQKAKYGYMKTLKKEMISAKSGFLLDDE
jgi:hypothetical protein